MNKNYFSIMNGIAKFGMASAALSLLIACNDSKTTSTIHYPDTKRCDTTHVYFGDTVADAYAWLEDDFSQETIDWTKAQNDLTRSYLDTLTSHKTITQRLTELWASSSFSAPFYAGGNYYYTFNDGSMNQPVLKKFIDGYSDPVIFNPSKWDPSGLSSANNYSFSKSGDYLAVAIAKSGSDWNSIYLFDDEGKQLEDSVLWVKFSGISWTKKGFLYSRYPAPKEGSEYSQKNTFHQVYHHLIGTPQSEDELIWEDKENPQRTHGAISVNQGEYYVLTASESTSGNNLKLKKGKKNEWQTLVSDFDKDYQYVGKHKNQLYFLTNHLADNNKIVTYNVKTSVWKDVVEEKKQPLQSVALGKDFMIVKYLDSVISKLYKIQLDDMAITPIDLDKKGTVSSISSSDLTNQFYFKFENYYTPTTVYAFDAETNETSIFFKSSLAYNPDDFETIQTSFASKDGTIIPLFITRKKGLGKSANTPCFLYGYGGFNIAITPHFKIDRIPFLEAGGIYCVANMRGGSEFGEPWHEAGTKRKKQNVFDDFIGAAEFLIEEGWTSSDKLAIHGRSNGGLLAGAVLTQRPDLMKVALPKVGVLDMLRYQNFTIGWAWAGDYGRSDDSNEMYRYLKGYSPLHNVEEIEYPATMIITGDHDDRVVPAHSFKFAAELQAKQQSSAPILLRVESGGGHGAGKPINLQIREFADQWAFVYHHLGM
jgi:prolyl oligopeptidase